MIWRIEIKHKKGVFDALGEGVARSIADLGLTALRRVEVTQIYHLDGDLTAQDVQTVCQELLADPVTQEYYFAPLKPLRPKQTKTAHTVEIAHNPGVMDPVEDSTIKGIRDLGLDRICGVRTAKQYLIHGSLTGKALATISGLS